MCIVLLFVVFSSGSIMWDIANSTGRSLFSTYILAIKSLFSERKRLIFQSSAIEVEVEKKVLEE